MKLIITENQYKKILSEVIHPSEAYDDVNALKTVCDGKRGIAFITLGCDTKETEVRNIIEMVSDYDLKSVRVPSNPCDAWIVFKPGYENRAKRLLSIAEKYGGFLSHKATKEDTIEIGKLLEYDEKSIIDFINKHF